MRQLGVQIMGPSRSPKLYVTVATIGVLLSASASAGPRGTEPAARAHTDGEKDAAALAYAPLPASLVARLTPRIDSLAMAGAR